MTEPDEDVKELIDDLRNILMPSALHQLQIKVNKLYSKIEQLRESRDNWKTKYEELKNENR